MKYQILLSSYLFPGLKEHETNIQDEMIPEAIGSYPGDRYKQAFQFDQMSPLQIW